MVLDFLLELIYYQCIKSVFLLISTRNQEGGLDYISTDDVNGRILLPIGGRCDGGAFAPGNMVNL